jgi:four helix bundle protein
MHPGRGLKAWEAANLLADEVRAAVANLPHGKRFGIASQLARAADSIAANIAEGCGRQTIPDQTLFYNRAISSAQEVLTFLKRARAAKLIDLRTYHRLTNRASVTHSLLAALIRSLREK